MGYAMERLRAVGRDPEWVLLPLRAYLGVTFLYAGLSKIGGSDFLDSAAPTSMHATLVAVKSESPIGGLLGPVESHSFAFGLLMALGETAVGIGVLLGLFTRVAAAGGMLISLSLFLTVTWNATPWYTGADLVYLFALTPLLLGGAGPLSADEWLAARDAEDAGPNDRTRRVIVAGLAGLAGLVAAGVAGLLRRDYEPASADAADPPSSAPPSTAPPSTAAAPSAGAPSSTGGSPTSPASSAAAAGPVLVAASKVPVGGAVEARDPKTGRSVYVLPLQAGKYTALDRTCPHAGCEVSFVSRTAGFVCPCHQSSFDPSGAVTHGPATSGLTKVPVAEQGGNVTLG